MNYLFSEINTALSKVNNTFSYINWGGCGAMAAILAYQMQKFSDDVRIVTCGYGNGNVDEVRNNLSRRNRNDMTEWEANGIEFYHVWVEFKWNNIWYAVDSTGVKRRETQRKGWPSVHKGSFTLNEMRAFSRDDNWNSMFDRWQIPEMRSMVSRLFTNIENNVEFSYE